MTYLNNDFAGWKTDAAGKTAEHSSGLSVRLEKKQKAHPSIDILGLSGLVGTPWAQKTDLLVSQGIYLLEHGG